VIKHWIDAAAARGTDASYPEDAGGAGQLTFAGLHGEKIYPREIEDVLLAQPGVRSAAVVAASDEVFGEVPVPYVVPAGPGLPGQRLASCPSPALPPEACRQITTTV